MKTNKIILFLLLPVLIFLQTCKEPEKEMLVSTGKVENIKISTADVSGKILDMGEGVSSYGHVYSLDRNAQETGTKKEAPGDPKVGTEYWVTLTNLTPGKPYYVRAYCSRGSETVYGDEISFTTLSDEKPTVTTASATNLVLLEGGAAGATTGGNVTSQGGTPVKEKGVCYSLSPDPNTSNNKAQGGSGTGPFTCDLTLAIGTTYYVKAYAINEGGTAYGSEISFKTKSNPVAPTVITAEVTLVTTTTAVCGGDVTSDGDSPIMARGVCWDVYHNPDLDDVHTIDPAGTGVFVSNITGLTGNTTYYVRAYATNSKGTSYGEERSFKTGAILPSVTTAIATAITAFSATGGGEVTSDGGSDVTVRGLCWSTGQNPTISGTHMDQGGGTGNFIVNMTGLTPGTTYYMRAYATNGIGINYGQALSFKTEPVCPTLTTASVTSIGSTSATGGGNVTNEGGAMVTAKGVCWSLNQNPTTADSWTGNGSGAGSFTSSITGLTPGTTYYVRAYGTNSAGTCYGPQVDFKTLPIPPSVTTNTVTSVAYNSAVCGGNVTNEGGAPVTARGVCWSTSQNPTTSNSKSSDGAGGGTFVSSITGLSPSTNYYARAYATNTAGTSYGGQQPFTTPAAPYITVTSPVATDHWLELENRLITWASNVSGNVTISLYKATSLLLIIVTGTTNDGSHTWTLPDNLVYGTDYKIRVTSVTNGSVYGESPLFKISESTGSTGTVGDGDGNTYNTIKIGKLWWTKQNLKTTRYNDYTFIGSQLNPGIWITLTYAAYCYYESNTTYFNTYGALYNWYAVNSGKLCPAGWHVPSMAEWEELFVFAGGETVAGGKLKEAGTSHWLTPNTSADNAYGFTALPGGILIDSKGYGNLQQTGFFWTSTGYSSTHSSYLKMEYNLAGIVKNNAPKYGGMSVRCVRD